MHQRTSHPCISVVHDATQLLQRGRAAAGYAGRSALTALTLPSAADLCAAGFHRSSSEC